MPHHPIHHDPIHIQDPDPVAPTGTFIEFSISGPAPDTAFVFVGGNLTPVGALAANGRLTDVPIESKGLLLRAPLIYSSGYKLTGYKRGITQSQVHHSTAVWISALGPFKPTAFQFSVDAIRYVGFNPAPNGGQVTGGTPFVPDGTLYFVLDIAWSLDDSLSQNCAKWYEDTSVSPPAYTCIEYAVPFNPQVSSYITIQDPPASPSPGHPHPIPGG